MVSFPLPAKSLTASLVLVLILLPVHGFGFPSRALGQTVGRGSRRAAGHPGAPRNAC